MGGMLASCQSEEVSEQLSKSKAIEKQLNKDRRAASYISKLEGIASNKGFTNSSDCCFWGQANAANPTY